MDNFQINNKLWNELLAGGPEFLLRGIIISHLCEDPEFNSKVDYVRELIDGNLNNPAEWVDAYSIELN